MGDFLAICEVRWVKTLTVRTGARADLVEITPQVEEAVRESGIATGICLVHVPHTTAGVTVNENADPSVKTDIMDGLERMAPSNAGYRHMEGNADSHIKASLMGSSVLLPIEGGRLVLGVWQGIFLCEFDGARTRQVNVQVVQGKG